MDGVVGNKGGVLADFEPYVRNYPERSGGEHIETPPGCLNTVGRLLLLGHRDRECVLSRLPKDVLRLVYEWIKAELERHILVDFPLNKNGRPRIVQVSKTELQCRCSFMTLEPVVFPAPKNRYCNMMPFKPADLKKTIPSEFSEYVRIIAQVLEYCRDQYDKDSVFYLTVHESEVEAGKSQRRGGLHIEAPGKINPSGPSNLVELQRDSVESWGRGHALCVGRCRVAPIGGIYMASNVADSCRVWSCSITDHEKVVGRNGNLELMRSVLDRKARSENLPKNVLCWFTDVTPHESLPLAQKQTRQYIRIVTGDVSAWFKQHSTENPKCKLPKAVRVVTESKFEDWEEQSFEGIFSKPKK